MEFLHVLAIKRIAFRKGWGAERTVTIKHRHHTSVIGGRLRGGGHPRR